MDKDEMKRQFLAIELYEDFDRRREEFSGMILDKDVCNHFTKLLKEEGVRFGTQLPDDPIHIDYF